MGEEREDPQKLKRIAAAAYDYEIDPRWADYWSNILIPPNLASRSDVVDHFKRKFYQRYIDPDLVIEAMPSSKPSQSTKPSASSSTSSLAADDGVQPRNAGSTTRSSGHQQLLVQIQVLCIGIGKHYNFQSMLGFSSLLCLPSFHLFLEVFPIGLIGYHLWALLVPLCILCMHYMGNLGHGICRQFKFDLIPILCRTLEHIAKFLRRNFNRSTMYRLQRNIIQTFMYWQLLKLMYHAPVSSGYHQSVWVKIGRTVNPLVQCYVPFLNTPVSAIQRWWFR